MSVTAAVVVAGDDGPPGGPVLGGAGFVGSLVSRLQAEYGVDADVLHRLATQTLDLFATAPVQAFVPILVEKRLRETCRALRSGVAGDGRPAVAGGHRR
jgi:hypothetical protein